MSPRFNFTIGRKIYAIVALSFVGLLSVSLFEMRDLQAGLEQQKTLELRHLTEIALGIAKEEYEGVQKGTSTDVAARQRAAERIGILHATARTTISGSTTCSRAW